MAARWSDGTPAAHLSSAECRPGRGHPRPLCERLSGRLMQALHRCGRRTDVLSVFGHLGGELVERFGPEPSGEPRRPERAILEHVPDLEVPAAGSARESRRARERAGVPPPPRTVGAMSAGRPRRPCRSVREPCAGAGRQGPQVRAPGGVRPGGGRRTAEYEPSVDGSGRGRDISELALSIQPLRHSRDDRSVDTVRRQCRMFIPRCAYIITRIQANSALLTCSCVLREDPRERHP
ncbi:BTAD domain-containing putative transcriptional regulator [Streptomyces sp. 2314.4]|uniref:BTAD domain-containing putative transcriptional regulator n=1 Tax=unclassified Streptomyces TaxID=2593676 RepID=UPI00352487AD